MNKYHLNANLIAVRVTTSTSAVSHYLLVIRNANRYQESLSLTSLVLRSAEVMQQRRIAMALKRMRNVS